MNRSRWRNLGIAGVACLVVIGLVVGVFRPKRASGAATGTPPEVMVAQVEQRDVPIYGEWIGTLDGFVNADVRAQVTGYLIRQDYTEGAFVNKGQLLFEIDPRPFQAAFDQAKGQFAQAKAQLANAEAVQVRTQLDVERYAPLAKEQAASQQDPRQRHSKQPRCKSHSGYGPSPDRDGRGCPRNGEAQPRFYSLDRSDQRHCWTSPATGGCLGQHQRRCGHDRFHSRPYQGLLYGQRTGLSPITEATSPARRNSAGNSSSFWLTEPLITTTALSISRAAPSTRTRAHFNWLRCFPIPGTYFVPGNTGKFARSFEWRRALYLSLNLLLQSCRAAIRSTSSAWTAKIAIRTVKVWDRDRHHVDHRGRAEGWRTRRCRGPAGSAPGHDRAAQAICDQLSDNHAVYRNQQVGCLRGLAQPTRSRQMGTNRRALSLVERNQNPCPISS